MPGRKRARRKEIHGCHDVGDGHRSLHRGIRIGFDHLRGGLRGRSGARCGILLPRRPVRPLLRRLPKLYFRRGRMFLRRSERELCHAGERRRFSMRDRVSNSPSTASR
ncbi:MAG: hypothetical protein MZV64_30440 [Ignavibacteriales bacterium]|nr:hypothetical protein [Ignavibacteriales bacterium]